MTFPRRHFLHLVTSAASLAALPRLAAAENYPTRPVHLIGETPAGGSPDIVARVIGQWLQERLGQPFVVDDRPGASGNLATEYVVNSAPDGYTLLVAISSNAINVSLFSNLNFKFTRDTQAIARLGSIPLVVAVTPSFPAQTLPEFIAYLKANPGKVTMASGGTGSPAHVAEELFCMMADVNTMHVPYRGEGLALPDVMSGQINMIFAAMPASLGYLKGGKLRPLAVTSATRQAALPDVPAVSEFIPGYEAAGWYGIVAPKATPKAVVDKLNAEINAALADPTVKARFTDLGLILAPGSPEDFTKFIADETEKWARVVKFAGIQPE
ncbi:MAG TPA: tripartite tricarboxylate transporter substrate binding protein [Xanthobacteraceae bacterium]|jgi:tripartite-type tricarboxylate transporter receptor subunit TctC|nr:tripartite tricarboxylate transporter substrate binding protein [Xanthobacteraceae bacterium]